MDLIDRNAVLNRYQEICKGVACMDCPFYKDGCAVEKLILDSAVVEAEPVRHGRWMSSQGCAEVGECYCSKCGTVYYADDLYNVGETDENGVGQALMPNYCPHCGAKMNEVNDV